MEPDQEYFGMEEKEPNSASLGGSPGFKSATARVHNNNLLIAMVGLPARGKTHISRKLTRYLTWLGYNAKVFNIGDKRRKVLGVQETAKADFFDPNNKEGIKLREQLAEESLAEIVKFLHNSKNNIAIFDGTNTTKKRRRKVMHVVDTYLPDVDFFFLEIICNDEEQIEKNLRKTKIYSPDFVGWKEEDIITDFKERIKKYESVYEEVGSHSNYDVSPAAAKSQKPDPEDTVPYIKIIDSSERLVSQNIQGFLNLYISIFLLHLHLEDRPIYLMRHGQSEFNVEDRIGGDPGLTETGVKFAKLLNKFFAQEQENIGCEKFVINTSTLKRTVQTASYLDQESGLFDIKKPFKILDEVNAGICDSLTYKEIEEKYPDIAQERRMDKMGYRYPKGESYYDVISRAQPYIVELERSKSPTVVISHNAVLRCLYGYFAVLKTDAICDIEIPLHTVIKITPQTYGYHEEIFSFDTESGDIKSFKSLEEMIISKGTKNVSFIKRSKQKLSFDDIIDLKRPQDELQSPGIDKKIYSTNDIVGMANKGELDKPLSILDALKMNTETKTKTKPSKLKRMKPKFTQGKQF